MDKVKAWLDHRSGKYRPSRGWHIVVWGNVAFCTAMIGMLAWTTTVNPMDPLTVVAVSVIGFGAGLTVGNAFNHRRWLRVKELTDKLEADLRGVGLLDDQHGSRRYRKALNEN